MFTNHSTMVKTLAKEPSKIVAEMISDPRKAHDLHMAVGISGEAGEILDAVKKSAIYGKTLDRANLVEELGDIEFYIEGLRQSHGITRDETIEANIAKLNKRYHKGSFTNEQAHERADKAGVETEKSNVGA